MRCKTCVDAAAEAERKAAAARQASAVAANAGSRGVLAGEGEPLEHVCSACKKSLPASAFNRTQLNKGAEKQRCQTCVSSAEKELNDTAEALRKAKLDEARQALKVTEATGSAAEKCAAAASLAALEAQAVTGLKPMVLGNGKGRGRGRGRGRGQ